MPKSHQKPTKEELKEKEKIALEATPLTEPELEAEPESEPETTPEPEQTSEPEPESPPEAKVEPEPAPELKKKLSASARENQKIYAKNRVLNQALADVDEIPEPTDEQLFAEFKDWDVMSDIERTLARETVISRRWRFRIKEAQDQAKKIEKWNESVNTFVDDPKTLNDNPELEGKQEEFRTFATRESNNSVPFDILVGAFLHEQSKDGKPHKERMFETGSGGPNDKPQPKSDKISLEDARKLRDSNYGKYKEMLRAGKIEIDI